MAGATLGFDPFRVDFKDGPREGGPKSDAVFPSGPRDEKARLPAGAIAINKQG